MVLSILLPQMSEVLHELGHMCIMLSQHRDEITIGYQAKTKNVGASGGNALLHYPDWTFEYGIVRNTDLIKEGEGENKEKMRVIGHISRVTVKKSMNETTHEVVHYPIRRKAPAGKSIWKEREIYDFLLMYDLFKKKGAWFTVDEGILNLINTKSDETTKEIEKYIKSSKDENVSSLLNSFLNSELEEEDLNKLTELRAKNPEVEGLVSKYIPNLPEKIHGEDKAMEILESSPALIDYFIDIFKEYGILKA